jgi:hypothetical protein
MPRETASIKLAMKIGGTALADAIGIRQWKTQAIEMDLPPDAILDRARALADRLEDAATTTSDRVTRAGVATNVTQKLAGLIARRAVHCRKRLSE